MWVGGRESYGRHSPPLAPPHLFSSPSCSLCVCDPALSFPVGVVALVHSGGLTRHDLIHRGARSCLPPSSRLSSPLAYAGTPFPEHVFPRDQEPPVII